jgi:hypothetical protein
VIIVDSKGRCIATKRDNGNRLVPTKLSLRVEADAADKSR